MRKGMLSRPFVAIVCTCVLSTMLWAQGDVNAPWDPAEHLLPYWESVEMEARLYNPAEKPDEDPNAQRRLSIQGGIRMVDCERLLGADMRWRDVLVLDQDGAEIYRTADSLGSRWYRATDDFTSRFGIDEWANELHISFSIPMDAERGYPSSLSRLEWSSGALIAEAFEVVDVPFEPNESWTELVPGLEMLVEEVSVEEGKFTYKIQAIYDPNIVSYSLHRSWHLRADETLPAAMLVKMDMLNAAGESVRDVSSGSSFGSSTSSHGSTDGLVSATTTGSGRCSACGDVTTIRYTFAVDAYEQEARFVLEDVPVPSF